MSAGICESSAFCSRGQLDAFHMKTKKGTATSNDSRQREVFLTKRDRKTFYICLTGLMAALACVSNYISIATPASRIHIGNAVCVLSGLLLGPLYGFFAAAIGNGLFDINGGYGM